MRRSVPSSTDDFVDDRLVFLLQGGALVDANFPGRRLLESIESIDDDIDRLRLFLTQNFENTDDLLVAADDAGEKTVQSYDARIQANREVVGDSIRLKVFFVAGGNPADHDIHTLRSMENELDTLRANTEAAPFLLWRQNPAGIITWANKAYMDLAQSRSGKEHSSWPLPVLFPTLSQLVFPVKAETRRIAFRQDETELEAWYDCNISAVGRDVLCTAIPADEAVRAENRRREFTQTLTKTFAELAIGLTIFDKSRRLVLFNPALIDLTSLPTDFLLSRPSLVSFLDKLRENRVMPEPRDYRSWREAIAQLEAAAVDGTYSETWSLADGQTYHVTGRPHPDGAVALLFEDISAEMSLTRHFRTELEQMQDVIDAFEDAVALFSSSGDLISSNRAYKDLWNLGEAEQIPGDLTESMQKWHQLAAPTPVWGDFREFALSNRDRENWTASVALRDGRQLYCKFSPQKAGATMAVFKVGVSKETGQLQEAV